MHLPLNAFDWPGSIRLGVDLFDSRVNIGPRVEPGVSFAYEVCDVGKVLCAELGKGRHGPDKECIFVWFCARHDNTDEIARIGSRDRGREGKRHALGTGLAAITAMAIEDDQATGSGFI